MRHFARSAAIAIAIAAAPLAAHAADISGAGSTFIYPVFAKWADTYKKNTGIGLNYQSIGSGGGIKQVIAKTVTFGATDKPLSDEDLEKNGLVQFPMIMGGIVPMINVEGVKPGELVLDGKTSGGLEIARRTGADQAKQFQRHLYGLGAWEAGLLGDIPLEQVRVGNVWLDRTGEEQELYVQTEPFNPEIVEQAITWLEDVIYAFTNGEEARKEPPREMCAKVCGFYRVCRAFDTDVSGLLTDPEVLAAVEMYREGLALEKQGAALKKQAKPSLTGVTGSTGEFSVRWIHINETVVPETTRAAYDRLDLRAIPKGK